MADRDEVKRKMQVTSDPNEKRYYDGLQNAIKILMNAFYGVFASAFYRFTDPKIGESITAFAREDIKGIIRKLEDQGLTVIYSDTDSVFFESPYQNLEDTVKFGLGIAEQFSTSTATLEFEKVLEPFFTHGKKKRYVGNVVWPLADRIERGYETRRTDSFDLQIEALSRVFDEILSGDPDKAVRYARKVVADTQKGNVPLEKLVISRTAKEEGFYKDPGSQANVQAMQKLRALGYEFVPGMKVSYIVTNSRKTPQEVEPFIDGREFNHTPDWQYYAERLATSMARVTDVFGWNEKSLLIGMRQKSLFSDEFETTTTTETATEKVVVTVGVGEDEPVPSAKREKEAKRKRKDGRKSELRLEDFL
jgi:DNA polymerase I